MSGLIHPNTVHRSSVVGTFGELQVVAAGETVVVDVRSCGYDTAVGGLADGRCHTWRSGPASDRASAVRI